MFFKKRIVRIFPSLFIFTIITTCIVGPLLTTLSLNHYFTNPLTLKYGTNIFLNTNYELPGVFTNNLYPKVINGSLWSLRLEVIFFVITVIIWSFNKKMVTITCILTLILQLFINYIPNTFMQSVVGLLPYYFIGCMYVFKPLQKVLNINLSILCLMILSFITIHHPIKEIIIVIVYANVIFSFVFHQKNNFHHFAKKTELSLGIYIYGFLMQQLTIHYFIKWKLPIHFLTTFVISLSLTVISSYVSYHLVEKNNSIFIKFCTKHIHFMN